MSARTVSAPKFSLDDLIIETPCPMDWDLMRGDDRRRFCSRCEKHVFNISEMSRDEAIELISGDGPICARIFRRPDGTVVTNECAPVKPKSKRRYQFSLGALVALLTASGGLFAATPWIDRTFRPMLMKWLPKTQGPPPAAVGQMVMGGCPAPQVTPGATLGAPATPPAEPGTDVAENQE